MCVSPLTSLMIDQKDKFTPCGISAEFVGELQTDRGAVNQVMKGNCQLVFISSECIVYMQPAIPQYAVVTSIQEKTSRFCHR